MIGALVIGTVLAVGALVFVLFPLFVGVARPAHAVAEPQQTTDRNAAITALREIEFDQATGKLSESDYAQLKARYTQDAVLAMRREGSAGAGAPSTDDEIEAAVSAYRTRLAGCPECGPRP